MRRTAERVQKLLVRLGRSLEPDEDSGDDALAEQPALSGCATLARRCRPHRGARRPAHCSAARSRSRSSQRAAHAHAVSRSTLRGDGYQRRRPEDSVLYQVVRDYWPAVRERAEEQGGLPKFIIREFEEYLRCGLLSEGCLHLACRSCGYSLLVALSCKRRGFCPACLGRRMSDTAVHLEQRVLPAVLIWHWICSLPWGLRALLGYDHKLCAQVVRAFVCELSRSVRCRAKAALGLGSDLTRTPGRRRDSENGRSAPAQRPSPRTGFGRRVRA